MTRFSKGVTGNRRSDKDAQYVHETSGANYTSDTWRDSIGPTSPSEHDRNYNHLLLDLFTGVIIVLYERN